jgi:plasmid maintenance system antidote protein VapI
MNIHILKKYCIENNITSRRLALHLNITEAHIYNIWGFRSIPSPKLALRIEVYTHGEIKAVDLLYPNKNINTEDL